MHADVTTGFLLPAAACWLSSLYCLSWQRDRPRDPAITAILAAFIARGIASLAGAPHVYHAVNHFSSTTNLARLLINSTMIVWSALILTAVAHWSLRPERARTVIRYCRLIVLAALAISVTLWSVLSVPETARGFSDEHAGDSGAAAALMLVYHLMVAAALIAVALCCIRFARLTRLTVFRVAMATTATGACCYLSFTVHRAVSIAGDRVGLDLLHSWPVASPMMTGTGTVLMMIGLTMPMVVPEIVRVRTKWRARRLYRRLEPLWLDLRPFVSTTHTPGTGIRDVNYLVYRRMVDIRDGLLALSHRFPDETTDMREANGSAARVAQQVQYALDTADSVTVSTVAERMDRSGLVLADRNCEEQWLSTLAHEYRRLHAAGGRRRPVVPV
ncbi:MAB_1171c family putative transporter [Gordonia sp. (in: high G+C Gram-positive bacteria)]|uniref:MAB_1171c family putative transporter n=1 Tax=Gordonia sp. (in: high G+C Gram-positive bacteria) TaxID=84139 RepID=UPI003F9453F0